MKGRASVRLAIVLIGLLAAARPALAQSESPEQVAAQIMAATRNTDWGRVAGLMHPSALHQLREMLDPLLATDDPELGAARQQMFGLASRAAAAAATDSMVFAGLLNFSMSQQAGLAATMRTAQFKILGTVAEGADTVHVVGRITMAVEALPISVMEVVSLVRSGTTWRGLLKGDMTAMASALRGAIERGR